MNYKDIYIYIDDRLEQEDVPVFKYRQNASVLKTVEFHLLSLLEFPFDAEVVVYEGIAAAAAAADANIRLRRWGKRIRSRPRWR